jgi:hypothetical protein
LKIFLERKQWSVTFGLILILALAFFMLRSRGPENLKILKNEKSFSGEGFQPTTSVRDQGLFRKTMRPQSPMPDVSQMSEGVPSVSSGVVIPRVVKPVVLPTVTAPVKTPIVQSYPVKKSYKI